MFMLIELAPEIETDMFTVVTCILHLLTVFFHITTFYWMFIEGKEIVSLHTLLWVGRPSFLLNVTNCCFDLLPVFADPALHQWMSDVERTVALFLLHQDPTQCGAWYIL